MRQIWRRLPLKHQLEASNCHWRHHVLTDDYDARIGLRPVASERYLGSIRARHAPPLLAANLTITRTSGKKRRVYVRCKDLATL